MDTIRNRFPLVNKMVLKQLNDQSLVNIKEACRQSARQLVNGRFFWIRIIKKYMGNFKGVEESWKEVINKTPAEMLKQLAFAVEQFCKSYPFKQVTPLHITAYKSSLELFQFVITRSKDKNPVGKVFIQVFVMANKWNPFKFKPQSITPLHIVAMLGNIEQCRLILDNVINGNPKDQNGRTPLEMAAMNGHLDVCRMIIERVQEKNPFNDKGLTPLHASASNGHIDICRLIIAKVDRKNPADNSGWTPLHVAAKFGHVDVYRLIMAEVEEKNPSDNFGWTPLHLAAKLDHLEVCKLIIENIDDKHPIDHAWNTPKMLADQRNFVAISKLFES